MRKKKRHADTRVAYGDPDEVVCPYCLKGDQLQRRLWGAHLNYCDRCRRMFNVIPEKFRPKGTVLTMKKG